MIEKRWHRSQDESDKSGMAIFIVDNNFRVATRLDSFEDFMAVSGAMDAAFKDGKSAGMRTLRGEIKSMINRLENES